MRATMDKAGRVVVPRSVREQAGLTAGEVELTVDGVGVRIEPVATDDVDDIDGRLVIPAGGSPLSRADVEQLRRADQR